MSGSIFLFGWSRFCVELGRGAGCDKFSLMYNGIFIEKHMLTPLEKQHMSTILLSGRTHSAKTLLTALIAHMAQEYRGTYTS